MILSLIGFVLAVCFCFWFAPDIVKQFCKPLTDTLAANDMSAQLVWDEVAEPFMVVIQITLVTAFAIASPWMRAATSHSASVGRRRPAQRAYASAS